MQPLEIALLLANVPALAWSLFVRGRPIWVRVLASVALLIMAVQIVVEGRRWQFDLTYIVTVWLFLAFVWQRLAKPGKCAAIAGIGCLVLAAALSCVLPVFRFPTPSGPFPIGTVTRHLVDSSRAESRGPHPTTCREVMIQIWYPADDRGPHRAFRSRSEQSLFKEHVSLVMTNASTGIPVARAPGRYPVLIFDHSWAGRRDEDTFLVEELASHGYVVVGIDHPYGSTVTAFPDGRVVYSTLGDWMDFSSDEALEASVCAAETELKVRVADVRFVLGTLERLDRCDPAGLLTGHLDTSRAGVVGFSFGGAVAAEACRLDARLRACIDFDGCLFGGAAREGVDKAFLVMGNQNPDSAPDSSAKNSEPTQRYLGFIAQTDRDVLRLFRKYGGYSVGIKGVSHMNFCDKPLFLPIRCMSEAGSIDPRRAMAIINACTLAFFNGCLGVQARPQLAETAGQYPEVRLNIYRRPQQDSNANTAVQSKESFAIVR